ncbi:MAG: ABC transporter ATP-binding protein [Synechococcales cyanobacterium]
MANLQLHEITKRFGTFLANDRISMSVEAGEIHALLGENGAGKSTLMNILSGLYQPDSGRILLEDRPIRVGSPSDAIRLGIGMIHQHFMLVPQLTVVENIILGTGSGIALNLEQKRQEIVALSQAHGLQVDPQAVVGTLTVGAQQRVEILKTLYRRARLLILDEPTAVLTPTEIESFKDILRHLARSGHTIIFISHKLEEVMSLCDRVTVLRRGRVVTTCATSDTTPQELSRWMVGREVLFQVHKSAPQDQGKPVLQVEDLWIHDVRKLPVVQELSFQLHAGEILGVAGVDGNGQRELAEAIMGLTAVQQGRIRLNGSDITQWSPQQRVKQLKIGYIPEDRQSKGLILGFTIARNLILKVFDLLPFCRHFFLQLPTIAAHAETAIQSFDIRTDRADVKVSQLSGGNQQKVILARELQGDPDVIVAMQPTRGLDVGAIEYVQAQLLQQRQRGAAILFISTELEQVMRMSDRIAVMYAGQFLDVLPAATTSMQQVGLLMSGQSHRDLSLQESTS